MTNSRAAPVAFPVRRLSPNDLLLKHARKSGAEVREGWAVTKFTHEGDSVSLEIRNENGVTENSATRF